MAGRASHDSGRLAREAGSGSGALRGFPTLQPYVPGRGAPGAARAERAQVSVVPPLPAEPCAVADLCERVALAADTAGAAHVVLAGLPRMFGIERAVVSLDTPVVLTLESSPPPAAKPAKIGGRARVTRPLWLLSSPATRQVHAAEAAVAAGGERFGWVRIERAGHRFDAEELGSLRIVAIALGQRLAILSAFGDEMGGSHCGLPPAVGIPQTPASVGTLHRTPLQMDGRYALPVDVAADDRQTDARRLRWDAFLASISHEVRTPLTSISGHAQLVGRAVRAAREPDGRLKRGATARVLAAVERHLPPLERQVTRIEHVIRDAQDLAEAEAGMLRLELAERDAVELARRAMAGADAETDAGAAETRLEAPETLALRCDAERVERALRRMIEYVAHVNNGCESGVRVQVWEDRAGDGTRYAAFRIAGADGTVWRHAGSRSVGAARDEVRVRLLPRDLGLALGGAIARLHGGVLRRAGVDGEDGVEHAELTLLVPAMGPHEQAREDDNDAADRRGG